MRILIVVPRQPEATGNHVTAARHRDGLRTLGHTVEIVEATPGERISVIGALGSDPDLVHLLHAYRAGAPWLASGLDIPFAVTLTGTDIHAGLAEAVQGPVIHQVLERAAAIITQNRLTYARLLRNPEVAGRLHYLPPGIVLGDAPYPVREKFGTAPEDMVFLHPAGIRPVKRNLELLHLCDPLAAACSRFRLIFCGPLLDPDYGSRFQSALAKRSWATWIGAIPSAAMATVMRQAAVVLNHSACEGLPNALLEASALGCPILARAIDGNAAVVEHGVNGLLYADDATFLPNARSLIEDPSCRRALSSPRPGLYDPGREAENLAAIFTGILRSR